MKKCDNVKIIKDVPFKNYEGDIRREIKRSAYPHKQYWVCLHREICDKWFYEEGLEIIK